MPDESYTCPFCGEPGEIDIDGEIDPEAGGDQVFVQDCAVCCRPATVTAPGGRRRIRSPPDGDLRAGGPGRQAGVPKIRQ